MPLVYKGKSRVCLHVFVLFANFMKYISGVIIVDQAALILTK